MICTVCNTEFNGAFCPKCGTPAPSHEQKQTYTPSEQYIPSEQYTPSENYSYQQSYNYQTAQQPNSDIVFDPSEKTYAILGNDFLKTFLSTGTIGKGFALLSDKRVYFRGKCLTRSGSRWITTKEERAVNIEDITGSGFTIINQIHLIILSVLFFLMSISILAYGDDAQFAIITLLLAGFFILAYFITRKTIFEINYPGGGIAFNLKLLKKTEAIEFQKKLMLLKDVKRNEDISATANRS